MLHPMNCYILLQSIAFCTFFRYLLVFCPHSVCALPHPARALPALCLRSGPVAPYPRPAYALSTPRPQKAASGRPHSRAENAGAERSAPELRKGPSAPARKNAPRMKARQIQRARCAAHRPAAARRVDRIKNAAARAARGRACPLRYQPPG